MEKLEQILDLIDHPERYSEQQVQTILNDEESRQLYETMVAVDAAYIDRNITADVDQAWATLQERVSTEPRQRRWRTVAASFVGLLLVSGIAFAAIHFVRRMPSSTPHATQSTPVVVTHQDTVAKPNPQSTPTPAPIHKTFDNVTLETMLTQIAAYYQVKLVFINSNVRHLRLYYEWDSQKGLQGVVNDLAQFENFSLTMKEQVLIVE